MKSQQLFELAVKILGLVFVYRGLTSLPQSIGLVLDTLKTLYPIPFVLTVVLAAWPFAIAYWLLRGAPLLVRIAFPCSPSEPQATAPFSAPSLQAPEPN